MSGSLKPYFYFVLWHGTLSDSLQKEVEPIHGVVDSEHIRQDFPLGVDNETIVLIF